MIGQVMVGTLTLKHLANRHLPPCVSVCHAHQQPIRANKKPNPPPVGNKTSNVSSLCCAIRMFRSRSRASIESICSNISHPTLNRSLERSNMSPIQLIKTLVVVAILGYLAIADSSEARNLSEQQELIRQARSIQKDLDQAMLEQAASNVDQIDVDDDDVDDDSADKRPSGQPMAASMNQRYQTAAAPNDLKTAASHHHHGHGVKGWLDMGAWTGKKGAFGWYDKHPVGGKKGK